MASRSGNREHGGEPRDSSRKASVEYNLEKPPITNGRPPGRFEWTSFIRFQLGAGDFRRRSAAFFLLVLIPVIAIVGIALLTGGLGIFGRYTGEIR